MEELKMENTEKTKKRIYKKWWFWAIIVLLIIAVKAGSSLNGSDVSTSTSNYQKNSDIEVTVLDFSTMSKEEVQAWFDTNKINGKISDEYSQSVEKGQFIEQSISANTVIHEGDKITVTFSLGKEPTTEEKNALKKAETYSSTMHMSKSGIYKQLTSEYGEGFTAEAAQYAIDNLEADWNANALAKAKDYQKNMNMSKSAIYKQLTSEYGEGFTDSEAQYAVDNLDE